MLQQLVFFYFFKSLEHKCEEKKGGEETDASIHPLAGMGSKISESTLVKLVM